MYGIADTMVQLSLGLRLRPAIHLTRKILVQSSVFFFFELIGFLTLTSNYKQIPIVLKNADMQFNKLHAKMYTVIRHRE